MNGWGCTKFMNITKLRLFVITILLCFSSIALSFSLFGEPEAYYLTQRECVFKETKKQNKSLTRELLGVTQDYCAEVVAKNLSKKCGYKLEAALKDGGSIYGVADFLEQNCRK